MAGWPHRCKSLLIIGRASGGTHDRGGVCRSKFSLFIFGRVGHPEELTTGGGGGVQIEN